MDSTVIKPYMDALSAQKAQLEGNITRGIQAVAIPATHSDMQVGKKDFLTVSGWWFGAIGVVAFIVGLIIGNASVIIAGCAAMFSGVYCYLKGLQAMRRDAYVGVGNSIIDQINGVVSNVSSDWSKFMTTQNDSLKKAIIGSTATVDDKVAMIDKVDTTPSITVDLSDVQSRIDMISSQEKLARYATCLPMAADAIRKAIDNVNGAQQGIYSTLVSKPAPAPAPAPAKPAAPDTTAPAK